MPVSPGPRDAAGVRAASAGVAQEPDWLRHGCGQALSFGWDAFGAPQDTPIAHTQMWGSEEPPGVKGSLFCGRDLKWSHE